MKLLKPFLYTGSFFVKGKVLVKLICGGRKRSKIKEYGADIKTTTTPPPFPSLPVSCALIGSLADTVSIGCL